MRHAFDEDVKMFVSINYKFCIIIIIIIINDLPNTVTSAQSLHSFWHHLKTYLFQRSFSDIIVIPEWTLQ